MLKNKFINKLVALLCTFMLLTAYMPVLADASDDASLKSLWLSSTAVINFETDVYEYTVNVPYTQDEDGNWELVMPEVYAEANGENADVDTQTEDNVIIVTVTAESGATQDYTITVSGIGDNLYLDGGFDNDLEVTDSGKKLSDGSGSVWEIQNSTGATLSLTTDEVALGNYAMKINDVDTNTSWSGKLKPGKTLSAEKRYYASMQAKLPDSWTASSYTSTHTFRGGVAVAEKQNYDADGNKNIKADGTNNANTVIYKDKWTKAGIVFTPSTESDDFRQVLSKWSDSDPDLVVDDYYVGDLVVGEISVLDEIGNPAGNVMMPTDGTSETQLYAKALNQFGTVAGLEEEEDFTWRLIGEPQGISISEDGLLSVDTTAEKNSKFYVEAVLTIGFDGTVQGEAKGVAELKVCDVAASELSSIIVDGRNLPGFSSAKKSYEYSVLYSNLTGDISKDLPKVTCISNDKEAEVDIDYPETVEGGEIVITVTSPDGVESVYTISLSVIGRNLYSNGDFESGINGWTSKEATLSHVTENPGKGTGAMRITGTSSSRQWYGDAVLQAGKTYIASNMIRLTGPGSTKLSSNFNGYKGVKKHYSSKGILQGGGSCEITGDWQTFITVLENIPSNYSVQHYYKNWATEPDVVVDEYYIGELIIADMVYSGGQSVVIPESYNGSNKIYLDAEMLNQLGNSAGLDDLKISWSTKEDYQGVYVEDNVLTVTGNAYAGTITVVGTASPIGSSQVAFCEAEIVLESSEQAQIRPRADNLAISGIVGLDETLTADYDYYQINQEEELNSVCNWQFSNSEKGTYIDIEGATDLNLTITQELEDEYDLTEKYIRFMVKPASESGLTGDTVYSNVLLKPTAPEVEGREVVWAEGEFGKKYKGTYTYYDANGDEEGVSTFRWLISDSKDGGFEPIEGETSDTYTICESDVDKYVVFEVTPVSKEYPYEGSPRQSEPVLCAAKPVVSDVEINKVSEGVYSVTYKYSHPLDIKEGKTIISWTVNGEKKSNESSVVVPTDKGCTLKVTVTPVAEQYPYEGDAVSDEMKVKASSKKVSASGGRGSGGGSSSVGSGGSSSVTIPEKNEEPKNETPVRYWASDAIDFVTAKGFMKNNADGNFDGAAQITRADFIYDVMLTLGEETTPYKGEFSDVTADLYYANYLQKAVDMGIISHDTAFNPNRNIFRQEVCKIIVLAMGISDIEGADLSVYKDAGSIDDWAKGYVSKAVAAKVLIGVADDEFAPLGNVTRDQTAVILKRLYEYKQGGDSK